MICLLLKTPNIKKFDKANKRSNRGSNKADHIFAINKKLNNKTELIYIHIIYSYQYHGKPGRK